MTRDTVRLIFTDLDGTLLNHDDYQWDLARPALQLAKDDGIPVIPCTSKTLAECLALQQQIGLTGPCIFENGAGVALPKSQFKRPMQVCREATDEHWICAFSADYATIRSRLLEIKRLGRYVFKGFGDMSEKEIAEVTDLPLEHAARAKKRLHTEPILWLDNAKSFNKFHKDVQQAGLGLTRGGRFVHVLEDCDKGQTMQWLTRRYDPTGEQGIWTIALGDSPNDIPMLQAADVAVIVKNPHRGALQFESQRRQKVIRTSHVGALGWNDAVHYLLTKEPVHG